jgi:hypothetical protein
MSDEGGQEEHDQVLLRAVEALERAGIPHALMGGLAAAPVGRDRTTKDIDLFVAPEQAEAALRALEEAGFRIERTDPSWLFKAYWGDALVDIVFESEGGIFFDDDVRSHCRTVEVGGRPISALAAEDIVIIKAIANAEHRPRHWFDGLAIVAKTHLDWPYLVRRARPHAARVASLLLYAVSEGTQVPGDALHQLFKAAERGGPPSETEAEHLLLARVRQALATDSRVNELHLTVGIADHRVVVGGRVATAERRQAIEDVLREVAPDEVRCEVEVLPG